MTAPPLHPARGTRLTRAIRRTALAVACVFAIAATVTSGCRSARRGEPLASLPTLTPEQQRGQILFSQQCYQCHPNGSTGVGPALNNKPLPAALVKTQVRKGLGAMPAYSEKQISDADLDALASYVGALRKS